QRAAIDDGPERREQGHPGAACRFAVDCRQEDSTVARRQLVRPPLLQGLRRASRRLERLTVDGVGTPERCGVGERVVHAQPFHIGFVDRGVDRQHHHGSLRLELDAMPGQVIREVGGLRLRVEDPVHGEVVRRDDSAGPPNHLLSLVGGASHPRDAVRSGNRKVGLQRDAVARRLDDLDAWRRRLAVVVGELDQGLRYSRHVGIVAAAAQVAADARRGGGARAGVVGAGLAGLYASLSAGFAALLALVCYLGAAWLIASPRYRSIEGVAGAAWRQVGAVGAAGLLAVLAYSAFRGDFVHAVYYGGEFGATALSRLVFGRDAMATEAVAALVLVVLAGTTAAWRVRERGR